ncbi:hypothetical protein MPDQ_002997 [Monascus purpureus]|uniref:HECT-type E3 ubiquitin transferase n=1 Tax=Monascus purpureus TaxID=5098 RepID=A0A507R7T7_MONPU|nr:hypothetical protein MPDQ_002997 [Monascus purpureus]BDD59438.1 hypothetical protein MAP00_004646 [Monascus purpureus]
MFQSFTGNARRPRQVNLGGRNTNPFAAYPSGRQHPRGPGPQNTLAIAQQERLLRQQERERLGAGRTIQRIWRGYRSRKHTHNAWREEWDVAEERRTEVLPSFGDPAGYSNLLHGHPVPYKTVEECLSQLRLLVQFLETTNVSDVSRLVYFSNVFQKTLHEASTIATEGEWTLLLGRLAKATLGVLRSAQSLTTLTFAVNPLLGLLVFLTGLIPKQMARISQEYYSVMAILTKNIEFFSQVASLSQDNLIQSVLALLRPITSETLTAYEWFARSYLAIPDLPAYLGTLDGLANNTNYKLLTSSLETLSLETNETVPGTEDVESHLWLLSYFIFFHRSAFGGQVVHQVPEPGFVKVVSQLLNSTALHISRRLELEEVTEDGSSQETPLPPFVKEQIVSLVNQSSITGLLSYHNSTGLSRGELADVRSNTSQEAKILATYALTLLRVFPRRGDDIRMWLYLGSAASSEQATGQPGARIPAIKFFWQASRSSQIFRLISEDSNNVLPLLKPADASKSSGLSGMAETDRGQEWTIILLFLELYTFVLKVMDDEEFFSSSSSFTASTNARISWTRESALPLKEVKDMTIFLKNLAFTLYWNAADLNENEPVQDTGGIRNYFSSLAPSPDSLMSVRDLEMRNRGLPGVTGIPLDYFKGLVTGLLRMIHERDSRRKFLPDGHWLMTSRFDMEGFIPAVVAEEENRHQLQDEEDEEDNQEDFTTDEYNEPSLSLVGTGRVQQIRRIEALRRRQQQAARRRQLQAVAPRLEILRNMPFFIPFATRVQIFREFIYRDQMRRRRGYVDPDAWRMSVAQASMGRMIDGHPAVHDILSKHHADIRRESVFEDAFDQFYGLGEGLKEPIQISFIDRFGTVEAGIDGGGVTKEFLTSVTSEAFKSSSDEAKLFEENDQHLLYPNPAAVEHRKELLRQQGFVASSPDWNEHVRDLLRRYEFLGRIIGKCLYEGILVDVNFAPFFLLKWALTGGTGSAQKESAYRANLNDLKDLDEGLYQGLLQLKNYPGDVEDFSLNFTVTDTIPLSNSRNKTITRDLKPDGSNTPVTNQNRLVYISYIARYRLQVQPSMQTNAFLQGLGQIIQPSWLSMFNQAELQTLVSGDSGDIDVADLRRNTLYGGIYTIGDDKEEHPTVKLFWEVMESMTNEERQKVLKFVTSTPRAPLLGFSHLNPRFSIRDSSEDQDRLPSTSTCVNLLKLPRYSNARTLKEKLLYAVNSGAGFDLS